MDVLERNVSGNKMEGLVVVSGPIIHHEIGRALEFCWQPGTVESCSWRKLLFVV